MGVKSCMETWAVFVVAYIHPFVGVSILGLGWGAQLHGYAPLVVTHCQGRSCLSDLAPLQVWGRNEPEPRRNVRCLRHADQEPDELPWGALRGCAQLAELFPISDGEPDTNIFLKRCLQHQSILHAVSGEIREQKKRPAVGGRPEGRGQKSHGILAHGRVYFGYLGFLGKPRKVGKGRKGRKGPSVTSQGSHGSFGYSA
jgi:hypothetical protein